MGNFKNIKLKNFRNFEECSLNFLKKCNVFYGKNGSGKTNILESISLFSRGRGFRKDKISDLIKKNNEKFVIKSNFENKNIVYDLITETDYVNDRYKKIFTIDGDKSRETLQNIYEKITFLTFLPEIERLFLSSPTSRRNFVDQLIFAHKKNYNVKINHYTKLLHERSKLLMDNDQSDSWLLHLENNISKLGIEIYKLRENQLVSLIEILNNYLHEFKLDFEVKLKIIDQFKLIYEDQDRYKKQLKQNRKKDSLIGGSKIGPHRSDFIFFYNDNNLVSQLSTGQQKTLILLIYLSQAKFLTQCKNKKPILLLDEVCSHLDDLNRNILLTLVESFDFQVFMTGTSKDLFSFLSTNTNFCNITH